MMLLSIDEAISKQRKIAETQRLLYEACILKEQNTHFLRQAEEHEQIAEWLEELKELREIKETIECNAEVLEQQGYNKAIADFVNSIKEKFPTDRNAICHIEIIAEHLKAGGENEI